MFTGLLLTLHVWDESPWIVHIFPSFSHDLPTFPQWSAPGLFLWNLPFSTSWPASPSHVVAAAMAKKPSGDGQPSGVTLKLSHFGSGKNDGRNDEELMEKMGFTLHFVLAIDGRKDWKKRHSPNFIDGHCNGKKTEHDWNIFEPYQPLWQSMVATSCHHHMTII